LKSQFDYILGNPPWFTYKSIKNELYQDQLRKLAIKYDVMPEKRANFTHLEIAAIFLAHASSYFLKEEGKLAFVLPRSFINADHHKNTITGKSKGFKIDALWDLEKVSPLFRIPSCVIFAHETKVGRSLVNEGCRGISISGCLPQHNITLNDAQDYLTEKEQKWFVSFLGKSTAFTTEKITLKNKITHYQSLFKQGATIFPRNFYFVETQTDLADVAKQKQINISTDSEICKESKKPWDQFSFSDRIETDFLFQTSIARNIVPYHIINPSLVFLPIKVQNERIHILARSEIRSLGYLNSYKWFKRNQELWLKNCTEKNRSIDSIAYLNWQNKLVDQILNTKYLVLYNASGSNANAGVLNRDDLQFEFIIESATYAYKTNDKYEAYYIASILNSTYPNELIKHFQPRGLFGARSVHKKILDVPFPKYNADDNIHKEISFLGYNAGKKVKTFIESHSGLDLSPRGLGKLRVNAKEVISEELIEIDKILQNLFTD